jgi:hypothetical protein
MGGAVNVQIVSNTSASSSANKSITATCPNGTQVVGGGFATNNTSVGAQASYASSTTVWHVDASEFQNTVVNWTVTAYAVCT